MSAIRRYRVKSPDLYCGCGYALACQFPAWAAHAQPVPPPAAKPASSYSAGVVNDWFSLALQLLQQTPGFSPPVAARALGYLGLTLHESVVPGMSTHTSLAGQLNELSSLPWAQPDETLHWPTVANAALATMTRMMLSNASAESKARIDGGHEAWGPLRRDQARYVPPGGAGQWSATPPAFAPALLPRWGANRPFVLKNAAECPAPPPAFWRGCSAHRPASPTTPTTTAAGARGVSRTSSRRPTKLPAHGCTPASISVLASPVGRPRAAAWPSACWP